jgi:hypothetical protein
MKHDVPDDIRYLINPDEVIEEIKDVLLNGDADEAYDRAENLGLSIDELLD